MKRCISFIVWFLFLAGIASAKEITIIYTGETHAMLYPCNCPIEPDGGIARRATLIRQIRGNNPDCLLLDSGGFFAGGLLDEHTQNTQLDSTRSLVNLKAMELMMYDAAVLGDDEFNFGQQFLEDNIKKTNLTFLSCNYSAEVPGVKVSPFIIKELSGVKVGIIGVTSALAAQKAGGIKFSDPKQAVKNAVGELKEKKADIIVLLSHLGESEDLNLINEVRGIDILITGHAYSRDEPYAKIGDTLFLRPTWQGRRLDKATLILEDKKLKDFKVENLRLSDKINADLQIFSVLPACFSANDCKKEGFIGSCNNGGSRDANCSFAKASEIPLSVITAKACLTCVPEATINFLKKEFPGLRVTYHYYPQSSYANKFLKKHKISGLPVYLMGQEIEKEKKFDLIKNNLVKLQDVYMLKHEVSGFSYFIHRKKIKGRFDVFLSLFDKNSKELLDTLKEFNPSVHFLALETEGSKFDAARGEQEVEEYLRAVCVKKYYPEKFWDYMGCRAKDTNTAWWDDCLESLDSGIIKVCAKGEEGKKLLLENTSLTKELGVMFGPTYLMENQEIFTSNGVPGKDELKAIMKR